MTVAGTELGGGASLLLPDGDGDDGVDGDDGDYSEDSDDGEDSDDRLEGTIIEVLPFAML